MLYLISHVPYTDRMKFAYKAYRKDDKRNTCIFLVTGSQSALVYAHKFRTGDWIYYTDITSFRLLV